jgi:hypothetical protein
MHWQNQLIRRSVHTLCTDNSFYDNFIFNTLKGEAKMKLIEKCLFQQLSISSQRNDNYLAKMLRDTKNTVDKESAMMAISFPMHKTMASLFLKVFDYSTLTDDDWLNCFQVLLQTDWKEEGYFYDKDEISANIDNILFKTHNFYKNSQDVVALIGLSGREKFFNSDLTESDLRIEKRRKAIMEETGYDTVDKMITPGFDPGYRIYTKYPLTPKYADLLESHYYCFSLPNGFKITKSYSQYAFILVPMLLNYNNFNHFEVTTVSEAFKLFEGKKIDYYDQIMKYVNMIRNSEARLLGDVPTLFQNGTEVAYCVQNSSHSYCNRGNTVSYGNVSPLYSFLIEGEAHNTYNIMDPELDDAANGRQTSYMRLFNGRLMIPGSTSNKLGQRICSDFNEFIHSKISPDQMARLETAADCQKRGQEAYNAAIKKYETRPLINADRRCFYVDILSNVKYTSAYSSDISAFASYLSPFEFLFFSKSGAWDSIVPIFSTSETLEKILETIVEASALVSFLPKENIPEFRKVFEMMQQDINNSYFVTNLNLNYVINDDHAQPNSPAIYAGSIALYDSLAIESNKKAISTAFADAFAKIDIPHQN